MPTLYVENIPEEVYVALKARARDRRTSIASEVVALLTENFPSEEEKARRRAFFQKARHMTASAGGGSYPPTEYLQREDRER